MVNKSAFPSDTLARTMRFSSIPTAACTMTGRPAADGSKLIPQLSANATHVFCCNQLQERHISTSCLINHAAKLWPLERNEGPLSTPCSGTKFLHIMQYCNFSSAVLDPDLIITLSDIILLVGHTMALTGRQHPFL